MKYHINDKPQDGAFARLELNPGEQGKITILGIAAYLGCDGHIDYSSIIVDGSNAINLGLEGLQIRSPDGFYPYRLADFNDNDLGTFSDKFGLPIAELEELRKLEKEYREAKKIGPR